MNESKRKVETFIIRAMCSEPGCDGEMLPNGCVLTSYPAKYSHDCNKCGKRECFYEKYPKFEYKEI